MKPAVDGRFITQAILRVAVTTACLRDLVVSGQREKSETKLDACQHLVLLTVRAN